MHTRNKKRGKCEFTICKCTTFEKKYSNNTSSLNICKSCNHGKCWHKSNILYNAFISPRQFAHKPIYTIFNNNIRIFTPIALPEAILITPIYCYSVDGLPV